MPAPVQSDQINFFNTACDERFIFTLIYKRKEHNNVKSDIKPTARNICGNPLHITMFQN